MPVRARTIQFLDELGEFLLALTRHWMAFVTGNVVMALLLMLYERFRKPIHNLYYIGMLGAGFIVAAYAAWSEEHRKRIEIETRNGTKGPRPEIAVRWIDSGDRDSKPLVKFYNGGSTDAYNVDAVVWLNEAHAIRFEPIDRIAAHDDFVWTPIMDNGPRRAAESHRHVVAFIRLALGLHTPEARELRKQLRQVEMMQRLMTFEPEPPDLVANFAVAYTDFEGKPYLTPHVLTYFDETEQIRIRLATNADPLDEVDRSNGTRRDSVS